MKEIDLESIIRPKWYELPRPDPQFGRRYREGGSLHSQEKSPINPIFQWENTFQLSFWYVKAYRS